MADGGGKVPVAESLDDIGIVIAEDGVVHAEHPQAVVLFDPAGDLLRAGDERAQGLHGAVGDAVFLGAAVAGADLLAVYAGIHQHLIAGQGNIGRVRNAAEGTLLGAVAFAGRTGVDIIDHREVPPLFSVERSIRCCFHYSGE